MSKKINDLCKLKNKIKREEGEKNTFFFEERNGFKAKGFLGTQKIFFVGLNPSTGNFPSSRDIIFSSLLEEFGFLNAHITDFIKIRKKNKEVKKMLKKQDLILRQISYLKEEIEILRPKIIVAIGCKTLDLLKRYNIHYKTRKITHYSWRFIKKEKLIERIRKELEDIKKE